MAFSPDVPNSTQLNWNLPSRIHQTCRNYIHLVFNLGNCIILTIIFKLQTTRNMWFSWWIWKGQVRSITDSFVFCTLQSHSNLFTLCLVSPSIEVGFFVLIAKISNSEFPSSFKFVSTQFQRTENKKSVNRTGTLH